MAQGGGLYVEDFIACGGTKSRTVATENYGTVCMNAFETPTPYFGDIGSGEIGENGTATIFLEPVFSETIENEGEYQVLLTQTSDLKISCIEKSNSFFVVYGEKGATFDWMICAVQKGYTGLRAQEVTIEETIYTEEMEEAAI